MRSLINTKTGLLFLTLISYGRSDEGAIASQLVECANSNYESCEKVVDYFIAEEEFSSLAIASDFLCVSKDYKRPLDRVFYCHIAGSIYAYDQKNTKKAVSRLRVSCAVKDSVSNLVLKQFYASACVLVAALENNKDRVEAAISANEKSCTDSYCLYNVAFALALSGEFERAIDYIDATIKAGNRSKKELQYFGQFPEIKRSLRFQNMVQMYTR
ncbi:MAG: hypothetical protein R3A80_07650 [Bdellovibrionota bacterium]